jgi:hypothetical protein
VPFNVDGSERLGLRHIILPRYEGCFVKKLTLLLSAFCTASVLSTPVAADSTPTVSEPGARTEQALACLLGFEPWSCANRLWGGDVWPITNCAKEYVHRWLDNCTDGPLERVEYLGVNAAGADVYDVQYKHSDTVYIIAPPGLDGKLGRFWIKRGLPIQVTPSSLVDIRSSATHKMTLYRRPWH